VVVWWSIPAGDGRRMKHIPGAALTYDTSLRAIRHMGVRNPGAILLADCAVGPHRSRRTIGPDLYHRSP
jgi:hypothetical protein